MHTFGALFGAAWNAFDTTRLLCDALYSFSITHPGLVKMQLFVPLFLKTNEVHLGLFSHSAEQAAFVFVDLETSISLRFLQLDIRSSTELVFFH